MNLPTSREHCLRQSAAHSPKSNTVRRPDAGAEPDGARSHDTHEQIAAELNLPPSADVEALALIATRKAVARGYTTSELAGCTQLVAAQKLGYVKRKRGKAPHYMPTPEGRRALVIASVLAAGFIPAGQTSTETVRVPTQASPVYGASGGELRTFRGRDRFVKTDTDVRVTVGLRTTNVYRVRDGNTTFIRSTDTRDIEPEQLTRDLLTWSTEHATR